MKQESFLEKNLASLRKNNPDLADKLIKHTVDPAKYQLVKGKDKLLNLAVNEKKTLYYDPQNILLSVNADLDAVDFSNPKLSIFLGFGLGYHLLEFIDKRARSGSVKRVLVVEESLSVLKLGLSVVDLSRQLELPDFLHFIVNCPYDNLYQQIYNYILKNNDVKIFAKSISVITVGGSLASNKEYYFSAVKYVKEGMNQVVANFGNSPHDSLVGLENILANIKHTLANPGIIELKDAFKGKTAVLVAAGPSLEKNIELLRTLKDKVFIICVDTSLRILLRRGIYPHMVTAIERGISVMNYFTDLDEYQPGLKDIYFAPATVVRNEIFNKCINDYGMKSLIVYRKFAHYEWLGVDKGTIESGKSGANLAFKILTYMGFKKIILIGQDLAFGANDQTHISGADHSISGMKKSPKIKEEMWVKGNYVEKIKTIKTWYGFLRYYEQDIAEFDGEVINATEGGAYIAGTKIMTFKEAIDKYVSGVLDTEEIIKSNISRFSASQTKKDLKIVKEIAENTLNFLNETDARCDKAIKVIENFKADLKDKTADKPVSFQDLDLSWLSKVTKEINIIHKEVLMSKMFYLFMMHIAQSFIIKAEIEVNSFQGTYKHQSDINAAYIKIMDDWFPTMKGLVSISRKYLEKAYGDICELEKKIAQTS